MRVKRQAACRSGSVEAKDVAISKAEKFFEFSDLDIGI
jgi:hypothetical protein